MGNFLSKIAKTDDREKTGRSYYFTDLTWDLIIQFIGIGKYQDWTKGRIYLPKYQQLLMANWWSIFEEKNVTKAQLRCLYCRHINKPGSEQCTQGCGNEPVDNVPWDVYHMTNYPNNELDGYLKPMIYSSKSWMFAYRFIGRTKSFLKFEKVLCILNEETKNAMPYNLNIDTQRLNNSTYTSPSFPNTKFKDNNNANRNPCGKRCNRQPILPYTWEIFNYRASYINHPYAYELKSCTDSSGQVHKPKNTFSNCDVFRKKLQKKGYNKFNNFGSVSIPQSESMFRYTSNKVRDDGLLMDGSHKFYGEQYVNARDGCMYPNDYLKCKF